jgi:hypothetical protein
MSRRSTPERIDAARRAATLRRLETSAGMSAERAGEWVARWEAQAATEGRPRDGANWDAGYRWIRPSGDRRG